MTNSLDNKFPENCFISGFTGDKFLEIVQSNMDLTAWGFKLVYKELNDFNYSKVIFNSNLCRVCFSTSPDINPPRNDVYITYGRLHAPNNSMNMVVDGNNCRCWFFSRFEILQFLLGYTPKEAAKEEGLPAEVLQFSHREDVAKDYSYGGVIRELKIEAFIWQKYSPRLFQLFDLADQKLWGEFYRFNQEYWNILEPGTDNIGPNLLHKSIY